MRKLKSIVIFLVFSLQLNTSVSAQSTDDCKQQIMQYNDSAYSMLDSSITRTILIGRELLGLLDACPDSMESAYAYSTLGEAYYYKGDLMMSIGAYDSAFSFLQASANSAVKADFHLLRSNAYSDLGMSRSALNDLSMALELYVLLEDSMQIGICHYNLGILHFENQNYLSAKDHFSTALSFQDQIRVGHPAGVSDIYSFLSRIHTRYGEYDSASLRIEQAEFEASDDDYVSSFIHLTKGELAQSMQQCDEAIRYFDKAASYFDTDPDYWSLIRIYLAKTKCLIEQGQLPEAENLVEYADSLNAAVVNSFLFEKSLLTFKQELSGLTEDYKKAFTYTKKLQNLEDSLYLIDYDKAVIDFEGKYLKLKTQEAERKTEVLSLKNKEQKQQSRLFMLMTASIGLLAILLGVLVAVYRSKTKREEAESSFKNKVISVLSHDIRTPMNQVQGVIDLMLENEDSFDVAKKLLPELRLSLQKSTEEVLTILEWARKELVGVEPVKSAFSLVEIVNEGVDFNKTLIEARNIQVEIDVHEHCNVHADRNHTFIALRNILNNAIKYSLKHGTIVISCKVQEGTTRLSIQDFGKGMTVSVKDKLFTQGIGTDKASGSGIGLYLTKSLMDANGISIEVASEEGKGSTFTLIFP
jgi:signal transduction histidine kinase